MHKKKLSYMIFAWPHVSTGCTVLRPSLQLCPCHPSLSPVCNMVTKETYTSAFAAGCSIFNSTASIFEGCSCACAPQPGAWLLPHRLLLEPLLLHAHLLPSLPHHDHGQGKSFFFINTNTDKYNLLSLIINTNKASPASLLNNKKTGGQSACPHPVRRRRRQSTWDGNTGDNELIVEM